MNSRCKNQSIREHMNSCHGIQLGNPVLGHSLDQRFSNSLHSALGMSRVGGGDEVFEACQVQGRNKGLRETEPLFVITSLRVTVLSLFCILVFICSLFFESHNKNTTHLQLVCTNHHLYANRKRHHIYL